MNKQERDRHGLNKTHITPGLTFNTEYGKARVTPIDGSYLKGAMQIANKAIRQEIVDFLSEPMDTRSHTYASA